MAHGDGQTIWKLSGRLDKFATNINLLLHNVLILIDEAGTSPGRAGSSNTHLLLVERKFNWVSIDHPFVTENIGRLLHDHPQLLSHPKVVST